jgi:2-keto-4-pentenoate hydratase/2-oxohepta-3-ene-1,7-dioic acid hydratase in catechol pathway
MKYLSYDSGSGNGWGTLLENGTVADLTDLAPTLQALLESRGAPGEVEPPAGAARFKLDELTLLPPILAPRRILCIGLNYASHREETGRPATEHPAVFTRYPSSITGHEQTLKLPPESASYDFEGELAVVMGRRGRRIAEKDALTFVAGYSCFMDGTIRDWQMHTHQYTPGKNFDCSGAMGPWITSADHLPDPNAGLRLLTRVNGTLMQDAGTDQMIFKIPTLIAYISSFTTLEPGDVIATGTPGGVGFKRNPPVFLKDGDRVEVEIEGIGVLANTVRAERA